MEFHGSSGRSSHASAGKKTETASFRAYRKKKDEGGICLWVR